VDWGGAGRGGSVGWTGLGWAVLVRFVGRVRSALFLGGSASDISELGKDCCTQYITNSLHFPRTLRVQHMWSDISHPSSRL